MTAGHRRDPRRTVAYWLDQISNLSHILIAAGIIPLHAIKWFALVGALGAYGAMKLTEPRRAWTNAERIARGLEPQYPSLGPLPLPEDGAPVAEQPNSKSGRTQ